MGVIQFGPEFVDEQIPRAFPCGALKGDGSGLCLTTPTRRWKKTCRFGHDRDVDLCSTHEAMCLIAAGFCRDCADRGGVVLAVIVKGD